MTTRFFKRLCAVIAIALLAIAAAALLYCYPKFREYERIAAQFDLGELDEFPALSEVFDNAGMRYSRLAGEVRYVVPLSEISPNFINALLAREDARFYKHHGVDLYGIIRAAIRNLKAGEIKEGASTLTQQLARNSFDLGGARWRRKWIEALLALRIERHVGKEKIIEAYANRIYYGSGRYGVETASRACFGKSARDLTLSEAAILAGLIRSPNRFTPLEDTGAALAERDQVLARMEELQMIPPSEAAAARAEPMPLSKQLLPPVQENYAMDAVLRDLEILLPKDLIARGGLQIYTTIDRRLQMIAERAVEERLAEMESDPSWTHPKRSGSPSQAPDAAAASRESPYIQGALVAIDNRTGGISALVGGRDFKQRPFNRAVIARRQIGSTFKPFVYAAAFERGLAPGTLIDDGPIRQEDIADFSSSWSPENSDGENQGMQPAALGLIRSRNTMTVRVGEFATRSLVRKLARNAGLGDVPDAPSSYLGAFETTLVSLAGAYTMFPNDGVRRQPYIIDHIKDRHAETIYKAARAELRCISPAVNYVMSELLRDVIRKGTASAAASLGLTAPAAGKTGTTDDFKDAWFVGYTTRLTCGVWVGMDRPQRIGNLAYGSKLALPIWVDFIQKASAWKYGAQHFAVPGMLADVDLCRVSGKLASEGCRLAGSLYHVRLPAAMIPGSQCTGHGGAIAGSPSSGIPSADDSARAFGATAIPVARAAPADSQDPEPPFGGDWRVIRKPNGFVFEKAR